MMGYVRPETLEDALGLMSAQDFTPVAGGTDCYTATERQVLPGPVLDLTGIPAFDTITATEDGIRIGAGTSWSALGAADLPAAFDGLRAAAREVGSVQIQNRATIGGNLCNASPAADGVPPLLTLDAAIELSSVQGTRVLPLQEFILGNRRTARQANELLTAVLIPRAAQAGHSAFLKLGARRHLVISIVMAAVRLELKGAQIARAAVSVGACSEVALRLPGLEAWLKDRALEETARMPADLVSGHLAPIDDVRADAGYRNRAAVEVVRRTLIRAGAAS